MRNGLIFCLGLIIGALLASKVTSRFYDETYFITHAARASLMAQALNHFENGNTRAGRLFLEGEMEGAVISLLPYKNLYFFQSREGVIRQSLQKVSDYRKNHPSAAQSDAGKFVDRMVDEILERILNGSSTK